MSNVPKLRFPEFSGEWEEKILGKISDVRDGTHDSPKYYDSGYPLITSKNLLANGMIDFQNVNLILEEDYININKRSKVNIGDILFGMIGTIGNPVIVKQEGFAIKNVALIKEQKILLNKFLIHYLKSSFVEKQFYKQNTGGTQKFIALGIVREMIINLPCLEEQIKIANFLSSIDKKIEQLTKKESLLQEYKKGVMQKIFSQELRFRAENGSEFPEWEEKKLGDILEYIQPTKYLVKDKEYNNSYKIPVLTAGKTFILGYTNETEGIFANNLPVIIFDDFTTANKFVDFPFKAKSSAMKILIPKNKDSIKFIYEIMQTLKYEIGGHERHWISKFAFLNIFMPCLEEQTKIANFLSSIDKKIELISKEIEKAKEFKKGLLQQMFV